MENKKVPSIIAITAIIGFFAVLGLLFFVEIPDTSRDATNMMLGFLGGGVCQRTSRSREAEEKTKNH